MKSNKKRRVPWITWLAFAVVVSALVSTTTLSRYISTVSGTGTARIASVEMDGSLDIDVTGLSPGSSKEVTFTVTNYKDGAVSEVSQTYAISVESTGNLPLTFALSTADSPATGHALTSGGNNTWTGGLLPHTVQTTHTYTLTVKWNQSYNDPKYADEIDAVRLLVNAQQQD